MAVKFGPAIKETLELFDDAAPMSSMVAMAFEPLIQFGTGKVMAAMILIGITTAGRNAPRRPHLQFSLV